MAKYTLDDLMRVCSEVEFAGRKFYLRTVGARHDDKRVNAGMMRATEVRSQLSDEGSEVHQVRIAPLANRTFEELQELALVLERSRLRRESVRAVVPERDPRVEEGDGLQEALEVEEQQAAEEKSLNERRAEWIEKNLELWRVEKFVGTEEAPAEWDEAKTREHVIEGIRSQAQDLAYVEGYNEMTLLHAVYTDKKHTKPFFSSLADVQDCNPALRRALNDGYMELDRFASDSDALKNLPSVQR